MPPLYTYLIVVALMTVGTLLGLVIFTFVCQRSITLGRMAVVSRDRLREAESAQDKLCAMLTDTQVYAIEKHWEGEGPNRRLYTRPLWSTTLGDIAHATRICKTPSIELHRIEDSSDESIVTICAQVQPA